ncbi:glycerate kinase [Krasilnikoviella flava]|uniref:Glycerate kinase n=1 Tax=Krasilnikoviella flava TaxID=526729 RepID=A0A1T5JNZ5_9MICO|nr:glycerate kinase [Krasilnikoviella flava]SKC52968.1 glycerate kinase [Krasilnikoviella flava]
MHEDVKNPAVSPRPLRVVVAPDSFKGSATATQVATALAAGARAGLGDGADVRAVPFADGGEGTLDAILGAWGEPPRSCSTTDALGRPTTARYGVSPDGRTLAVEAAEAYGLPKVSDVPLRPLDATSHGVGTVVLTALDDAPEAQEVVLFVGGSASTDGGAGLLTALGAALLDDGGAAVPPGGGGLRSLARVDLAGLDPRARALRWRIACDVDNPLLGPRGAAAVFGPQKGATDGDVALLDDGLAHLADALAAATGHDARDLPGAGASGGLPVGLSAALGAALVPGGELVADAVGLADALEGADLVLTGEGRLDEQSLHGKVVDTVVRLVAGRAPVVVVAGGVELTPAQAAAAGIAAAFSLAPGPRSLAELSRDAVTELERTAEHACRLFAAGRARR